MGVAAACAPGMDASVPSLFEAGIIAQFIKLEDEQAGMVAQEVASQQRTQQAEAPGGRSAQPDGL